MLLTAAQRLRRLAGFTTSDPTFRALQEADRILARRPSDRKAEQQFAEARDALWEKYAPAAWQGPHGSATYSVEGVRSGWPAGLTIEQIAWALSNVRMFHTIEQMVQECFQRIATLYEKQPMRVRHYEWHDREEGYGHYPASNNWFENANELAINILHPDKYADDSISDAIYSSAEAKEILRFEQNLLDTEDRPFATSWARYQQEFHAAIEMALRARQLVQEGKLDAKILNAWVLNEDPATFKNPFDPLVELEEKGLMVHGYNSEQQTLSIYFPEGVG